MTDGNCLSLGIRYCGAQLYLFRSFDRDGVVISEAQRRRQAKRDLRVIKQKAAQNQDNLTVIQKFIPVRIRE